VPETSYIIGVNKGPLNHLDLIDERVRELQGFLRGLLLDGQVSRAEVCALRSWLHSHSPVLENEHPFVEILPYLRTVLDDPNLTSAELRDELHWMWERLRTIHLRHPSPSSDLTVFLGLVKGVLADEQVHPSEIDLLLRWLENCHGGNCETLPDSPYPHIRTVLQHYRGMSEQNPEFAHLRQYLEYITELLLAA